MKRKFSNQFSVTAQATENEKILYKQLKDVTDDLQRALDKGLSIEDNLSMVYKVMRMNSGIEVDLGKDKFNQVKGAFIAHTEGVTITSQKIRTSTKGTILVTLEFEPSPANITLVLVGGDT